MKLFTDVMELRGVKSVQSSNGKMYYYVNCEDVDTGDAKQFYCTDINAIPEGLKKGDRVKCSLFYTRNKALILQSVMKA